jgi:hypothetical protein
MDTINMLLNSLYISDVKYNVVTKEINFLEYNNYIINNINDKKAIENKINNFNKNISIQLNIHSICKDCNLSLNETINTLNYLLSRKEIIDSINYFNKFKEIIEILFSRIIVIHLDECNKTNDILMKNFHNAKMCEYAIYYSHIFMNSVFKNTFDIFYKSLTYRSFNIATNYGCIISWMTFARLAPHMINDDYYPKINKETDIYQKINFDYLNNNILFEKEFKLFQKYHG